MTKLDEAMEAIEAAIENTEITAQGIMGGDIIIVESDFIETEVGFHHSIAVI